MSDWLEHSEQVEVPVSIQTAWDLWSDLELMPQWMNWIDSVEIPLPGCLVSSKKFPIKLFSGNLWMVYPIEGRFAFMIANKIPV